MAAARNTDIPLTQWAREGKYSQACIKRSPLRQKFKTGDLLKDEYEMFYDGTRKKEHFNTGDCSIEVTIKTGLTVTLHLRFIWLVSPKI